MANRIQQTAEILRRLAGENAELEREGAEFSSSFQEQLERIQQRAMGQARFRSSEEG